MLEQMGISVEFSHHEGAPGQQEIDLRYADALSTADNLMTFRVVVKEVALSQGINASFMPKPFSDQAGSGMHTHMSLFEGDNNAFYDASAEYHLSKVARYFIAGLLRHAAEITAVTNQWVNSYKRLAGGGEAPSYICWGRNNRSALVRVPMYKPNKGSSARVELRSIDSAANPYLAFALMLAAGLAGIEGEYELPEGAEDDVWSLTERERQALGIEPLPRNLDEAIRIMERSDLAAETLGDHVFDFFLRNKRAEFDEYRRQVTPAGAPEAAARCCVDVFVTRCSLPSRASRRAPSSSTDRGLVSSSTGSARAARAGPEGQGAGQVGPQARRLHGAGGQGGRPGSAAGGQSQERDGVGLHHVGWRPAGVGGTGIAHAALHRGVRRNPDLHRTAGVRLRQHLGERPHGPTESRPHQRDGRAIRKGSVEVVGMHHQVDGPGLDPVLGAQRTARRLQDGGMPAVQHLRHGLDLLTELARQLRAGVIAGGLRGRRGDGLDARPVAGDVGIRRQWLLPTRLSEDPGGASLDQHKVSDQHPYVPALEHGRKPVRVVRQLLQPIQQRPTLLEQGIGGGGSAAHPSILTYVPPSWPPPASSQVASTSVSRIETTQGVLARRGFTDAAAAAQISGGVGGRPGVPPGPGRCCRRSRPGPGLAEPARRGGRRPDGAAGRLT